jgi:hypothetical protein
MSFPRPRRTYVVSLYDVEDSVVVEAVQRDQRTRLANLDGLPSCIREWEDEDQPSPRIEPRRSRDAD